MPASRWWFGAFVIAVFLAGTSIGVIVDRLWLLPQAAGPDATVGVRTVSPVRGGGPARGASPFENLTERNLRRMQARLDLTDAQAEEVRPLLDAWLQRIALLQRTTRNDLLEEVRLLEERLEGVLTPEQIERFGRGRGVLIVPGPGREGRFGTGRIAPRAGGPGSRE